MNNSENIQKNLFEQGKPPKPTGGGKPPKPSGGGKPPKPAPAPNPKQDPPQTTTTGGQTTTGGSGGTTGGTGQQTTGGQTNTGGGGTTVTKQDPVTKQEPKRDPICDCWFEEDDNYFYNHFPKEERDSKAKEFSFFASTQEYSPETYRRIVNNIKDKCGTSNCLYHQSPKIRELATAMVSVGNLSKTKRLYDIWKEAIDQKKSAESKPAEPEKPKSTIEYLNLDTSNFFPKAMRDILYGKNTGKFQTNLDDLKKLADSDTENCKDDLKLYYDLFTKNIEFSFGDPKGFLKTEDSSSSKYWYGFLNVLMDIKRNLKNCKGSKLDRDLMERIADIPDTDVWNFNINIPGISTFDEKFLSDAEPLVKENTTIRKKLIEYKEMKTLKESVRNKILLTKENKDKKVNKISENLYKIAGDFYNDRYDVFFNKYVKLKESYKKSKMFLMEGASDNFKNAFVRVFKGDEEELVRVAIPWFTSKLGLEGTVKAEVEEKLKSKYSGDAIADLFEDDWSDIVVSSIINNAKSDVSEPTNAMDAVEKALMSNMRADFKEDLKNSIKNLIYPVQDSRKTEIVNLANELKNAILASKDGEESQDDTDSKVDDIFS